MFNKEGGVVNTEGGVVNGKHAPRVSGVRENSPPPSCTHRSCCCLRFCGVEVLWGTGVSARSRINRDKEESEAGDSRTSSWSIAPGKDRGEPLERGVMKP